MHPNILCMQLIKADRLCVVVCNYSRRMHVSSVAMEGTRGNYNNNTLTTDKEGSV